MANAATVDLTSLANDLQRASGAGIDMAAQQIIRQTAMNVQSEAITRAPIKSGRLRSSISIRYEGPLRAVIGPQVDYGVYQEFGTGERGEFPTGPITIRPKTPGGFLAFKVNGRMVYTKKVTHRGIRPRRYMRGGLEAAVGTKMLSELADKGAALITRGPNA
jgi:phage gpG-like protein